MEYFKVRPSTMRKRGEYIYLYIFAACLPFVKRDRGVLTVIKFAYMRVSYLKSTIKGEVWDIDVTLIIYRHSRIYLFAACLPFVQRDRRVLT